VVYGRTQRSDTWWRALPEGRTDELRDIVRGATADGTGLDGRPRFALAHGRGGTRLVGVACRLADLGTAMAEDEHGRPLHGFVGWLGDGPIPRYDMLLARYRRWALATYEACVGPVWDDTNPEPVRGAIVAAPWPPQVCVPAAPTGHAAGQRYGLGRVDGRHVLARPQGDAALLWDHLAAGHTGFTLVTGWSAGARADLRRLDVLCADDLPEARILPRPAGRRSPDKGLGAVPGRLRDKFTGG
jgi:hypothetical protein